VAVRVAAEVADGWAPVLQGIELRSGVKGVFKVSLDGNLLFDKSAAGRMPDQGEVAKKLEQELGPKLQWRKPH
jgi:predicted Rdx family selenoprotein